MNPQKTCNNIGKLTGKLLVFGGSYSNFQALEKLQSIAEAHGIPASQVICTGDVVGYCAQPAETVQAVRDWGIHCILGNVEIQLRDGELDCGCDFVEGGRCNLFSTSWYPFAQSKMQQDALEWMGTLTDFLRFEYAGNRFLVVHGGFDATAQYVFASTPWAEKVDQLLRGEADVILAGHCGLPFSQTQDGQAWLNPGVIGMPANDGTTRVWYMLIDTDAEGGFHFSHQAFEYDYPEAAARMRAEGLPAPYARTLETGLWDNMEILPTAESLQQGVPLNLSPGIEKLQMP